MGMVLVRQRPARPESEGALSRSEKHRHPFALLCVRKTAPARTQVIDHVISIAGAWDDSGDLFVAEQELEKKLTPGGGVEVPLNCL
jgi:hypothetical protein